MHDKRGKLNQPLYTARHTLSPSRCAHFPPSILKLSWQTVSPPLELLYWNAINSLMLCNWSCNHIKISDFVSISLNYIIEYMITLPLNKYYFISTIITITSQNYYIKRILYIYSTIIMILGLWL